VRNQYVNPNPGAGAAEPYSEPDDRDELDNGDLGSTNVNCLGHLTPAQY